MVRRITTASIVLSLAFVLPAAAAAYQEGEGGEADSAEVEQISVDPEMEPASPIPPVEIEPEEQPWTSRFFIPMLVLLTVGLMAGLAIYYFARIKGKYRVVSGT